MDQDTRRIIAVLRVARAAASARLDPTDLELALGVSREQLDTWREEFSIEPEPAADMAGDRRVS